MRPPRGGDAQVDIRLPAVRRYHLRHVADVQLAEVILRRRRNVGWRISRTRSERRRSSVVWVDAGDVCLFSVGFTRGIRKDAGWRCANATRARGVSPRLNATTPASPSPSPYPPPDSPSSCSVRGGRLMRPGSARRRRRVASRSSIRRLTPTNDGRVEKLANNDRAPFSSRLRRRAAWGLESLACIRCCPHRWGRGRGRAHRERNARAMFGEGRGGGRPLTVSFAFAACAGSVSSNASATEAGAVALGLPLVTFPSNPSMAHSSCSSRVIRDESGASSGGASVMGSGSSRGGVLRDDIVSRQPGG